MSTTLISLLGFIAWALALLVLMESLRAKMFFAGDVKASEFNPANTNLSPFMQRLARAHANCYESLPVFGGLMLVAVVSGNEHLTSSLALVFLGARIAQSIFHVSSASDMAATLRFLAFVVQMGIACYWAYRLIATVF